jgi:NTP pyrophosphatase (non-canonical NTP hydrolase)
MQMGIITETAELVDVLKKQLAYGKDIDWVNVKEEIGDIFWYMANWCVFNDKEFEDIIILNEDYLSEQSDDDTLYSLLKDILLCVLNHNLYEEFPLGDIEFVAMNLVDLVQKFTSFTLEEILQTNIDKLSARFPEGFTQYHALNRDLETERSILEQ